VAWTNGPLTVAGDPMLLGPRHFVDDPDQTPNGLEREIIRNVVVNVSLGVEYVFARRFPVRAGFFTDFAASDPVSQVTVTGFGLATMTEVEDDALDRCYAESGQDPTCFLASCSHN
jgi:hypothetical protein